MTTVKEKVDEIKEILDFLKRGDKNKFGCLQDKLITYEETQLLLDYITNLQEENKILKENAEHNDKVVDKAKWNENLYKSRCEKAIEYIKNEMPYLQEVDEEFENVDGEVYFTYKEWNGNELLNILQGSDKDE